MAAAFYLPLYHWFGLNPVPFHIAILSLLALNTILVFLLARQLGCEDLPAFLAALTVSYHAGLPNLQYSIAMVYDVLCCTFFVGAVLFYVRIRRQKRLLRPGELVIFFALSICALNSKEMALTVPFVLVAYEWFYHRLSSKGARLVILFAVALTAVDLLGKRAGSNSMLSYEAYQPVFSLQRFMAFQKSSLHDLLGLADLPGWRTVVAIWIVLTYLAWRRDRPVLRFCWAWMLLTPIPIEFLVDRVQGCLYIPLVGWAIFGAVTFSDLARTASHFLAEEPLFSRLGRTGAFALLVAFAILLWARHMRQLKLALVQPAATREGALTWNVIEQLRALNPHAAPMSQVVFLNDPFTDWDMTFIGQLWFGDPGIHVYTQRMEHLSPGELARMDQIFDFQNGKLVRVK
jgi:hypothetical protein